MSQAGLFKRGPADEDRSPFSNKAHRIDCCDAPFTSERVMRDRVERSGGSMSQIGSCLTASAGSTARPTSALRPKLTSGRDGNCAARANKRQSRRIVLT